MRTKARFFCENCHTEVRAEDKVCPSCGRFFGHVKCPQCMFTGEAVLFRRGCPSCGYLGGVGAEEDAENSVGHRHPGLEYLPVEDVDPESAGTRRGARRRKALFGGALNRNSNRFFDLPLWFYHVVSVVLLILLVLLGIWFANLI